MLVITVSFSIYLLTASEGVWAEKNQESSDVTNFRAVVNEMRNVDVLVPIDISDCLTEVEAN